MFVTFVALVAGPPKFPLTVESIMRGPALVGHAPRSLRWSADGQKIAFSWAKADGSTDPSYKSYVVNRDGTGLKLGSIDSVPTDDGLPSGNRAGGKIVFSQGGDVFLYDVATKTSQQITNTTDEEEDPVLVAGGTAIIYTRSENLYRIELGTGVTRQLTDVKSDSSSAESSPSPEDDSEARVDPNGIQRFRGQARPNRPTLSATTKFPAPPSIKIPAGFRRGSWVVSATGKFASMSLSQAATGVKRAPVPNYITDSGYSELMATYERPGANQAHSKAMVVNLETGAVVEIAPARPGRLNTIQWSEDGTHAIAMATADDHKDAWIMGFDVATGKVSVLWDEHDDAWIGGPGRGLLGWLPGGNRFYFESEKSGFANLMTMSAGGGEPSNLTEGKFEVSRVQLDIPRHRFIFVSSEGSPFKRHIDTVDFDGGVRRKLADYSADEDANFAMSPDGKEFAVVRSMSNRPAELFVNGVQVTTTPTAEFLAGPWIDPPIVMVPARDGTPVPSRLYKPKNWRRGGPAVLFVHGAGYLQNVYDGWSHYFREYMFHHVLMDKGYAVLDMDFRGSAGYGKAWRTAIYRHMGGVDLTDEVDGANYLVRELGVDRKRIGIYGGSYGGFITFMAMFTTPDVFAAGAALRPVADWANYNHGYTSEILNTPQTDPEAYKVSSPINFVSGLKGALLICHGVVDTNVHFQDSIRVVEKLIELGKTNWDVAPYPVEDHAFTRASSWTDEYRRILALFERTIGANRPR